MKYDSERIDVRTLVGLRDCREVMSRQYATYPGAGVRVSSSHGVSLGGAESEQETGGSSTPSRDELVTSGTVTGGAAVRGGRWWCWERSAGAVRSWHDFAAAAACQARSLRVFG